MKSNLCLVFGVFLSCCLVVSAKNRIPGKQITPRYKKWQVNPDIKRNVSELISDKGYPVENHVVQTKDGFLLSMQHIPHGKNNRNMDGPKQPVLLQHGILSSASDFVVNYPEQSLGFLLADAGYDVWLGNTRGNTYSRHHIKYSPDMQEFWDFSFDEMGKFDLPAMMDYVLNVTQQEQLFYIGHSQGTTAAFALFSENPEYNKKVKLFVALAPVATVGELISPIRFIAPFSHEIDVVSKLIGANEFFPNDPFFKLLSVLVCDTEIRYLCEDVMFLLFGVDMQQLNHTRVGVYTAHTPAGSSAKSLAHYGQMINSKRFTKFDYGKKGNLQHYNQTTPPEYDVSKITVPVALAWSLNDALADPTDVKLLQQKLKTVVSSYCVPFPQFNHIDFVIAVDAKKLLNDHVMSLLKNAK